MNFQKNKDVQYFYFQADTSPPEILSRYGEEHQEFDHLVTGAAVVLEEEKEEPLNSFWGEGRDA